MKIGKIILIAGAGIAALMLARQVMATRTESLEDVAYVKDAPLPPDTMSLFTYQGSTYEIVESNTGKPAIVVDNKTIPIDQLSWYATPEQKAAYVPQGSLVESVASRFTDVQLRELSAARGFWLPVMFNRAEHYTAQTWTDINSALLSAGI